MSVQNISKNWSHKTDSEIFELFGGFVCLILTNKIPLFLAVNESENSRNLWLSNSRNSKISYAFVDQKLSYLTNFEYTYYHRKTDWLFIQKTSSPGRSALCQSYLIWHLVQKFVIKCKKKIPFSFQLPTFINYTHLFLSPI